jgi:hypothetical protein
MYCSTPKDPEPLASETESPGINSSLSRKRVPTSKWATLGVRVDVNGLVLVDEGVSTLLSGLPNGVSKSLDFRLVDFRLVGDIAAPEIGLGHLVGVYLVAMEVAFPDRIYKIDFNVEHHAHSVPDPKARVSTHPLTQNFLRLFDSVVQHPFVGVDSSDKLGLRQYLADSSERSFLVAY